ncbi:N-acetylmuramoyl-L-alanine amidase [Arsenophonus endosymbiont of Bemisia tabaci]|uniref:N-acetylmuramoyl-L-alanine amidase n=1 Tax=Arsenophonus endosymbiont of Bemisia tabaci TaxID=536059 RepID=UPI0015F7581D|nr:N-acetylmuramoyl-L-alanine amidase [Arsenophonus endosymbiont of Bemisia tabaci]CAA2930196.1 N-acetylmuramoyl-L-alanine amidase AmiD [Arsenophonus endosymbiont of Bemisia tabaci Q2]
MRKLFMMLLVLMIVSCSSKTPIVDRGNYYIDKSFSSISQDDRVKFLIFHYTTVNDARSLQILTQAKVSAHYLIPSIPKIKNDKPVIYNFVPEDKSAWHAGLSNWNGRLNLNDSSIGVEIVNKGFTEDMLGDKVWYPFNEQQISAIIVLAKDIIKRYNITPHNVLAHSDIAPLRKYDPGKLFPWKRLAELGIGAWPDEMTVRKYLAGRSVYAPASVSVVQKYLQKYGYDKIPQSGELDEETRRTISAFQLHFRRTDISGNADAETEAIARALLEKYRS